MIAMKITFFGAPIQLRVVYALIASLLWWAVFEHAGGIYLTDEHAYWVTGAAFSALVLVPYLPSLKGTLMLRALALLLCGAISYWAAVSFAIADPIEDLGLPTVFKSNELLFGIARVFGIAGVVGALIVGIGARLFVPLALPWRGWLMLAGAGLLGGIVLGFSEDAAVGAWGKINYTYWLPGHLAWEVLVCLALYYGSDQITPPRARP